MHIIDTNVDDVLEERNAYTGEIIDSTPQEPQFGVGKDILYQNTLILASSILRVADGFGYSFENSKTEAGANIIIDKRGDRENTEQEVESSELSLNNSSAENALLAMIPKTTSRKNGLENRILQALSSTNPKIMALT